VFAQLKEIGKGEKKKNLFLYSRRILNSSACSLTAANATLVLKKINLQKLRNRIENRQTMRTRVLANITDFVPNSRNHRAVPYFPYKAKMKKINLLIIIIKKRKKTKR
jgi:hypothetical protein